MSAVPLRLVLIVLAHCVVTEAEVITGTISLVNCSGYAVYNLTKNTRESEFWQFHVGIACLDSPHSTTYMEIEVDAEAVKKLSSTRNKAVKKLIVTRNLTDLDRFDEDHEEDLPNSMRLSFTSFGMATVSSASEPPIDSGVWYIGITYRHETWNTKNDTQGPIKVRIVKNYRYIAKI